ncbi:MAG: NADH:ubiquinone reductase (Na(+)-transporting) subunit B [Deltaproteobacteria bacterium]|nr:NADH:ubiquinone reductase (Na(+)-transporting) subunit B [Deltaproteobacteria bacterium]
MKQVFDKLRPHFSGHGRLAMLGPLFEAVESFFYIPNVPAKTGPFLRDSLDLKRFMSVVLAALLPPLLFGIYNTGHQACLAARTAAGIWPSFSTGMAVAFPIIAVSYGVGFAWEILFAVIRRHPVSEGFLVTGLLFPLTLPPTIPLWQVAIGISFGVVIGKEVFGGTGRNLFNPALTARAFIFFAYPAHMSGDRVWVAVKNTADAVTGATALAHTTLSAPFNNITELLSSAGFTFSRLFYGAYPGTIGGTSALCCLLGAAILLITGIASFRIMFGGIAGLLCSGLAFNLAAGPGQLPWLSVNPFYHLVLGGFAFGIVYMATDPVTAPGTDKAKWIYGFFIGALTLLVRVLNPAYPEGVMLAILFMNIFSPLLEYVEIRFMLKKRIPNV